MLIRRIITLFFTVSLLLNLNYCIAEVENSRSVSTLLKQTIEYRGIKYTLKNRLITILVLGIDQREEDQLKSEFYRTGGQADFQMVIALDDVDETISIIPINRDTMAEMNILNVFGRSVGKQIAQICLAYSFGEGSTMSGRMAVNTASNYLKIPKIDYFYAVNMDGISVLNDLLGGIEVYLEDDFTQYDETMVKGTTVKLEGKQAEYYLRGRYYIGDGSNLSRMKRQMQYLEKAKEALTQVDSAAFLQELYDVLSDYVNTNMSRGLLINLGNMAKDYTVLPFFTIEGETKVGNDGLVEFYPNEDSLMQTILSVFYSPIL